VNQLYRYLDGPFGKFGVIVTRHPLPRNIARNLVDLWSAKRVCIIALVDTDIELMVSLYESKTRDPVDVLKRAYVEFERSWPI
jgi:hypothetical protein